MSRCSRLGVLIVFVWFELASSAFVTFLESVGGGGDWLVEYDRRQCHRAGRDHRVLRDGSSARIAADP